MWRSSILNNSWRAVAVATAISLVMLTSVSCTGEPTVTPSNNAMPSPSSSVNPGSPSAVTPTSTPAPTVATTPTVGPTSTSTATPTLPPSSTPTPPPTPNPTPVSGEPRLVMDINAHGPSNPSELTQVGNEVFFAADDGVHGTELWKSDGTPAGTTLVKDIRPGAKGSGPADLTNLAGRLFFSANDGVHGTELWKSDGTAAGTVMVKDLYKTPEHSYGCNGIGMFYPPIAAGNQLFFVLQCGGVLAPSLYVSDGTAAGTHEVCSSGDQLCVAYDDMEEGLRVADALGGRLYYVVETWDAPPNEEIWVSDGTAAGTHRMAGSPSADVIRFLPAHGQNLYFVTGDDNGGSGELAPGRLWRTDGTQAGTMPLTDIGELTSAPTQAVLMGKRLYFADGGTLWKTDGTASGTQQISDGDVSMLEAAGGRRYFWRGDHLWISDGIATGTTDLGQFGADWPGDPIAVGSELCFAESNWQSGSWALWESDGTAPGTHEVKSFVGAGYYGEWDVQQAAFRNQFLFGADDVVHGAELWSYTP